MAHSTNACVTHSEVAVYCEQMSFFLRVVQKETCRQLIVFREKKNERPADDLLVSQLVLVV